MTNPARRQQSISRAARALALLALTALAALTVAAPGLAASCGKKVVDDWYADGRVDGTYPAHCYDDAIEALPRDVRDYSSAKDDISRALQNQLRGLPAPPATTDPTPGDGAGPGSTTPTKTTSTKTTSTKTTSTKTTSTKTTSTGKTDTSPTPGSGPSDDDGPEAGPAVDTASADSVPLPLLVLAGLALLLVAAGAAGYLARRVQARRVTPPTA